MILLCATEPQTSVTRVEWLANETTEVHLYRNGHDELDDQATAYKGRTSLFNQEVPKGNCSLKLMVKDSDAGTYHCSVSPVVNCSITLTGKYTMATAFQNEDILTSDVHSFFESDEYSEYIYINVLLSIQSTFYPVRCSSLTWKPIPENRFDTTLSVTLNSDLKNSDGKIFT